MPKDIEECVNYRLREERLSRQWSQQEIADHIGATPNTVSRWELGITYPSPYFRTKLCQLFGKTTEELGFTSEAAETSTSEEMFSDLAIPTFQRLIGRDELLKRLSLLLHTRQNSPFLALHGLPGAGKTALAAALVYEPQIQEHFRDGVLWAGLGPRPHVFGLLSRWGSALGLDAGEMEQLTSAKAWALALRAAIGTRRMLLVIDDVWCIEDALALRVGGTHCASLVTTRFSDVAYRWAGEDALLIPELSEGDALRLFAHLAPQAVQSEPEHVRMLIQGVGGLPLAITLVGKYLHLQSHHRQPQRLRRALEQLSDAKKRLQLTLPQAPLEQPPHLPADTPLSLQATITVSDQYLNETARAALRALACLPPKPNTFSEEAALAVADTDGETLDGLCDAGLLESRGMGRYTIHQTIADYARTEGLPRQAEARMIAYFISRVESEDTCNELLEREVENILAAFQLACRHEAWQMLLQGIHAFASFLAVRGLYPLVKPYLVLAHDALCERHQGNPAQQADACLHLGRIADFQGAYQDADHLYATGVTYARASGEESLTILLLAYWGEMLGNAGHYQRAEQVLLEGLQHSQAPGYKLQACLFLKNLGEVAASLGNYEQGITYHQQGLELACQLEHKEMVSVFMQNLASHQACRGNLQQAESSYREALEEARALGYLQRCSAALSGLGFVILEQGRYAEAEVYLEESLALARQIHSPVRMSCVLQNLGILKSKQGDDAAAEVYLQESLEIASAIGHTWLISETGYYRGELLLKQGRIEEAFRDFERTIRQTRERGEQELLALAAFGLAQVLRLQGEERLALASAEESLALFHAMQHEQAEKVAAWLHHSATAESDPEQFQCSARVHKGQSR